MATIHFGILERAYLKLLEIDEWPGRRSLDDGQTLLCGLRDAIAQACGQDPLTVQMRYEQRAVRLREKASGRESMLKHHGLSEED